MCLILCRTLRGPSEVIHKLVVLKRWQIQFFKIIAKNLVYHLNPKILSKRAPLEAPLERVLAFSAANWETRSWLPEIKPVKKRHPIALIETEILFFESLVIFGRRRLTKEAHALTKNT